MTNTEEFARLGQAIGDAINRLPDGYKIEIDLLRNDVFVCLTDPDGCGVEYMHAGVTLTDEIKRMIDAAVEETKRRE